MGSLCAFRCQNVPGSFKCTCPYGYTLAADGRHCEGLYYLFSPHIDMLDINYFRVKCSGSGYRNYKVHYNIHLLFYIIIDDCTL